MIRIFIACIVLVSFAACVPSGSGPATGTNQAGGGAGYAYVPVAGQFATPQERAACEAVGGTIQPAGLGGFENCIQSFADGGQSCRDASDCIGRCMNYGDFADFDDPVTGQCEASDSPFGCAQEVIGGRAEAALCVD